VGAAELTGSGIRESGTHRVGPSRWPLLAVGRLGLVLDRTHGAGCTKNGPGKEKGSCAARKEEAGVERAAARELAQQG
jgi:hypothetical protein